MAKNEGSGNAEDAAVSAADGAEEEVVEQEDPSIALKAAVESAQTKVDRQKEHLEGAEQALADAKSALKEN